MSATILAGSQPTAPASARPAGGWDSAEQSARIALRSFTEVHLCARPDDVSGGLAVQARSMYSHLLALLRAEGAAARDVVAEKVFFSDIVSQAPEVRRIRRDFYRQAGDSGPRPAITFVQQPPARPGQLCEVQALVILPTGHAPMRSFNVHGLPGDASGRVIEMDGLRHVFLSGLTDAANGDVGDFARRAGLMFRRAESALGREGLSFRDVVRTWFYLADINRDYGALNLARREFFLSRGVHPAPASTGIDGLPWPPDRACGLDLRAIVGNGRKDVRPIHAPTLNEAPSYGADFSRGMRVTLRDRAVIYISGTASIDAGGNVVAVGRIEGQVERMLLNVAELLEGQRATYSNVVSAITYLKRPEYAETFRRVCERRGFPETVPNTLCVADVCRPDWLCEMEVIAVLA